MLEPMNFIAGTNIFNESFVKSQADKLWSAMSAEVREAYGGEAGFDAAVDTMRGYMNGGSPDTRPVIEAYTNALLDVFPQVRYQPMDLSNKVRNFVATHLPEAVYDALYVAN